MNYLLSYEVDGSCERKLFDSGIELTLFIDKLDMLNADYSIDDLSGVSDKEVALEFILNEEVDNTVNVTPNEKKTQRGNILFTPSVYENMQILAELEDTSFNNLLHELAKDYASKRADEIERYKKKQKLVEDILTML